MADLLAVGRLARRGIALGSGELGVAELQARLRLGDVGARQVADLEPVAGRLEVGLGSLTLFWLSSTIARSRITSM